MPAFPSASLRTFRARLLAWFRKSRRDLPWRRTRDAYRVWVSEIMLQQTQVAAVVPYFQRFLAAFPTLTDLAAAEEAQVLRLWEGLGYYRRARQLHAAARLCVDLHYGEVPRDYDALLALPGIGRYTAGAVLSIAHDARLPILEANTVRLLSRLLAYRGDPLDSAGQKLLWRTAEELLPRRGAGEFNQALMELGSVICSPTPRCDVCPLAPLCPTRAAGAQAEIPRPKRPKAFEEVREAAVVVRRRGRVLLVRRGGGGGRWGGLWDFPRFPFAHEKNAVQRELASEVAALTGEGIESARQIAVLKHGVTRFRITLVCYEAKWTAAANGRNGASAAAVECRWVRPAEMEELPMNVTGRKLARLALAP